LGQRWRRGYALEPAKQPLPPFSLLPRFRANIGGPIRRGGARRLGVEGVARLDIGHLGDFAQKKTKQKTPTFVCPGIFVKRRRTARRCWLKRTEAHVIFLLMQGKGMRLFPFPADWELSGEKDRWRYNT
jgi:hypothetical protein